MTRRPAVARTVWLPAAAWLAFLPLGAAAAWLGAGAYATALAALPPFAVAGALLRRVRIAVGLTLLLGLAILVLLADPLLALGLKAGTLAGAAAFGALALPLGSGVAQYRRARAARRRGSPAAGPIGAGAGKPGPGPASKKAASRRAGGRPR